MNGTLSSMCVSLQTYFFFFFSPIKQSSPSFFFPSPMKLLCLGLLLLYLFVDIGRYLKKKKNEISDILPVYTYTTLWANHQKVLHTWRRRRKRINIVVEVSCLGSILFLVPLYDCDPCRGESVVAIETNVKPIPLFLSGQQQQQPSSYSATEITKSKTERETDTI